MGDILILKEFDPRSTPSYSGRELQRQVMYLFKDNNSEFGLDINYVILGIKPID